MNHVKSKDKAGMSGETLNAITKIRLNGPPLTAWNAETFTEEYLLRGNNLCNPATPTGGRKRSDEFSPSNSDGADRRSKLFTT